MLTNRLKAQLIIIAAFVLGIVVGASGQYLILHQSLSKSGNSSKDLLDDLSRSVKLSSEQRSQVEQIVNDSRAKYQEVRNQTRPLYDAVRNDTRRRISAILSTEQQLLYDQWNHELDAKREQKEKAPSPSNK